MTLKKDMELFFIKIQNGIKGSLKMILDVVREKLNFKMEIAIKDYGKMIKFMGLGK